MSMFRIVIADDHEVVRQGVRTLSSSQSGWEVCGEAATGRQAIDLTQRLKPDVLILDIGMPDMNGLEAARNISRSNPQTAILILTMHESEQIVREVFDIGARGYVLKSDAGRDLVAAVDSLQHKKPFFTSKVAQMVLDGYLHGNQQTTVQSPLTGREREIVQLIAEGNSNKEAAARLGI